MDTQPIPQDEWIARSNLRFFKRLEAPSLVPQIVSLSNELVSRTMRDHFEVVSRDVYYISVVARQMLADRVSDKIYQEEEILKAERDLFKAFDAANSYFDTRIKQAEQALHEAGMAELVMRGGASKLFEALCTSRTATKWLELLKKADHYLVLNYQLWVTGEIGPANWTDGEALAAKLNNERGAKVTLAKLVRKINGQFSAIRELVNRVVIQREAEAAERRRIQSDRDKAKLAKTSKVASDDVPKADESTADSEDVLKAA